MIPRSTDALLKRKNKKRLILDVDSTEDPAHGNQEHMAYNGYFGKNCFHPLFCFSADDDGCHIIQAEIILGIHWCDTRERNHGKEGNCENQLCHMPF